MQNPAHPRSRAGSEPAAAYTGEGESSRMTVPGDERQQGYPHLARTIEHIDIVDVTAQRGHLLGSRDNAIGSVANLQSGTSTLGG